MSWGMERSMGQTSKPALEKDFSILYRQQGPEPDSCFLLSKMKEIHSNCVESPLWEVSTMKSAARERNKTKRAFLCRKYLQTKFAEHLRKTITVKTCERTLKWEDPKPEKTMKQSGKSEMYVFRVWERIGTVVFLQWEDDTVKQGLMKRTQMKIFEVKNLGLVMD